MISGRKSSNRVHAGTVVRLVCSLTPDRDRTTSGLFLAHVSHNHEAPSGAQLGGGRDLHEAAVHGGYGWAFCATPISYESGDATAASGVALTFALDGKRAGHVRSVCRPVCVSLHRPLDRVMERHQLARRLQSLAQRVARPTCQLHDLPNGPLLTHRHLLDLAHHCMKAARPVQTPGSISVGVNAPIAQPTMDHCIAAIRSPPG